MKHNQTLFVDYLIICLTEIYKSIKVIEGENLILNTDFAHINIKLLKEVALLSKKSDNNIGNYSSFIETNSFRNLYYFYEQKFTGVISYGAMERSNIKRSDNKIVIDKMENIFDSVFINDLIQFDNYDSFIENNNTFSTPIKSKNTNIAKPKSALSPKDQSIEEIKKQNIIFTNFNDSQITKINSSKKTYSLKYLTLIEQ